MTDEHIENGERFWRCYMKGGSIESQLVQVLYRLRSLPLPCSPPWLCQRIDTNDGPIHSLRHQALLTKLRSFGVV